MTNQEKDELYFLREEQDLKEEVEKEFNESFKILDESVEKLYDLMDEIKAIEGDCGWPRYDKTRNLI